MARKELIVSTSASSMKSRNMTRVGNIISGGDGSHVVVVFDLQCLFLLVGLMMG